jgi:hypothetical protein
MIGDEPDFDDQIDVDPPFTEKKYWLSRDRRREKISTKPLMPKNKTKAGIRKARKAQRRAKKAARK